MCCIKDLYELLKTIKVFNAHTNDILLRIVKSLTKYNPLIRSIFSCEKILYVEVSF